VIDRFSNLGLVRLINAEHLSSSSAHKNEGTTTTT